MHLYVCMYVCMYFKYFLLMFVPFLVTGVSKDFDDTILYQKLQIYFKSFEQLVGMI